MKPITDAELSRIGADRLPWEAEQIAAMRMCWAGARIFGVEVPPMKRFLPNAYERWYDALINDFIPKMGDVGMTAFIESGFDPLDFYKQHSGPSFMGAAMERGRKASKDKP